MDVNAGSPRMLCTQGRYLAPVQAPPGARIRFRLFRGKRGITAPETFIMPGPPPARAVPSTLIPCTQDRDFMIYDWASRHEAACRIVRETHPDLLFIGDSITHFWGGAPVDEPHRDICKIPGNMEPVHGGNAGGQSGVRLRPGGKRLVAAPPRRTGRCGRQCRLRGAPGHEQPCGNTDGEILEGIRAVCREITGKLAKAVIILQGFYPRNSAREGTAERIAGINLLLNRLPRKKISFIRNRDASWLIATDTSRKSFPATDCTLLRPVTHASPPCWPPSSDRRQNGKMTPARNRTHLPVFSS